MKLYNLLKFRISHPSIYLLASSLLIAAVIAYCVLLFNESDKVTHSEFNKRQLLVAKQTASGIRSHIESMATSVRAIAQQPNIETFLDPVVMSVVELEFDELVQMGANDLGIIDADGILRHTVRAPELEGTDFSQRPYFKQAKSKSYDKKDDMDYSLHFIEFKGVEEGKKGVLLSVPILSGADQKGIKSPQGKFIGLIVCTFKLDMLTRRFIAPLESTESSHAIWFSDNGELLWPPDHPMYWENISSDLSLLSPLHDILTKVNSGWDIMSTLHCRRFDGHSEGSDAEPEMHLVAATPVLLEQQRWPLVLYASEAESHGLFEAVYFKQLLLMGMAVVALLAATSYALVVNNRNRYRLENDVAAKTRDLDESHRRFITLLDSLDAYVFVINIQSNEILFANKALLDCFGDVVGKVCWQTLQVGQTGRCVFCPNHKLLTTDGEPSGIHSWEVQNTRTQQWWMVRGRAIRWVNNQMVALEVAIDVTERKQAEIELKRSHNELGTFCGIMKEIGTMDSLDSIGGFLVNSLGGMLDRHEMILLVFNKYRDVLYAIAESGSRILKEHAVTTEVAEVIGGLDGITISLDALFKPPVVPDTFPVKERQTIIPFQVNSNYDAALVLGCGADCCCEDKDLDLIEVILMQVSGAIKRAVRHSEEIRLLRDRIENTLEYCGIVGKAPEMQVIYKLINDIAPTDATVLIQGESGTGKELVARAIHHKSDRRNKPFIVINCAAYPATLLESELFGHEKGAFTGATSQKSGRFEQASGGTVFLDEIGEVPLSAQIKLLRVLQTQKFERLGGTKTLAVNVRILSATNKNLLEEVKKGAFREDLYYRLNVIPITLPPLRKRRNDIPLLIEHFQQNFASKQGHHIQGISSQALRRFLNYHWPGNVRELENSVEHAVILSKGGQIDIAHLPIILSDHHGGNNGSPPKGTLMDNEKKVLIKALEEQNWNKSKAAIQLNISRSALYDKIKKYNITKPA